MTRVASRCSSVLSQVSIASRSLVALQGNQQGRNIPILTIRRPSAPCCWHAKGARLCSSQSFLAILPVGNSPSRSVTTSPEALLDGIKHAEDIELLLPLLSANKARLSADHIALALSVLLNLRKQAVDLDAFDRRVASRPEFVSLCDLAEHHVSTFNNTALVDTLFCSLALLRSASHPLVRELRNASLQRLDEFDTQLLSKMAVCLGGMGEHTSPAMGRLVNAFSRNVEATGHFRELSTLMKKTHALMSRALMARVLAKLKVFLDAADVDGSSTGATCADYRKVFMCISRFPGDYKSLMDRCANHMVAALDDMTTIEVCALLAEISRRQYANLDFVGRLVGLLQGRLTTIRDPVEMALSTEVLGVRAPAHVKFQLEENAVKLLDEMPVHCFGNLCVGLGKMGYLSPTPLHARIREGLRRHSDELTLNTLLPVVEYHRKLVWMTEEFWQPLLSRTYELTMEQVTITNFSTGVYILSLIPTFHPNRELLERLLRVLPLLHGVMINFLFRAMKYMTGRKTEEKVWPFWKEVLAAYQRQAVMVLHENTSVQYILGLLNAVLAGKHDLELLDAIYGQLLQVSDTMSPHQAARCARRLYQTRYYSEELMARIMDVTLPNLDKVSPLQVLYLVSPYCSLSFQPEHSLEAFLGACAQRVIPFMDQLPCGYLVDLAHQMSLSQHFPEAILRHIFSLEFLTKLDEEMNEVADRCHMYRRKLMFLNRTVALECPELQVPWFHEEYCQEMLKNSRPLYDPTIHEIRKHLVEVLGGAQYLRSFVTTPYYINITFECIFDASGAPLSCANYGSALTRKKGLSSSVLSDLMQWDTERTQLPEGAQRVAIDYATSSYFCVNSGHMGGMAVTKKRHLELLGYQYIQIPFFEWGSLHFTGREEKEEYLNMKLLGSDTRLTDIASAPPSSQVCPPIPRLTMAKTEDKFTGVLHSYDPVT